MKRRAFSGGAKTLAIAGATLGALGAETADAVPIYNNPDDVRISPGQGSININLSNLLNPTSDKPDAVLNYNFDTTNNALNLNFNSLNNMAAAIENPVNRNGEIGPRNNFLPNFNLGVETNPGPPTGEWPGATNAFLGMMVDVPNSSPHFGWVRLTVDDQLGVVLHDYAIESEPNTAITAGAGTIPEPGSLGLLALGAVGLAAWRKRRSRS
jgi:hypothetical protein